MLSKTQTWVGIVIFLALAATVPAQTNGKNTTIWGKQIMKQPYDKEPFYEVQYPAWIEDITRVTYCFSVMGPEARDKATELGSQMSEMGFVSVYYALYDSRILLERNPTMTTTQSEESLRKEIADYERRGIRILAVAPPNLQGEIYEKHPDWRLVGTNTTEVPPYDKATNPLGGALCLLGPWGDHFNDLLVEILTKYPEIDAFSFDGLHDCGYCYCQHCRENYRRDTGKEIPNANMDDPEFRSYQHWADRRMESVVQQMQERLKSIKPEVALVTWSTNAGRWGHLLSIPRNMPTRMNLLFDAPDQEFWMDETNRGNTLVPAFANAYIWAVSNHRIAFSSPYLFSHGNPYGADSFTPEEVYFRMMLVLTWGVRPSAALAQSAHLLQPTYDSLEMINARVPWMTRIESEPWAALVMSDNTKTFYGRTAVEERYLANVLGAFRTTVEEHMGVTIINDWNLNATDLARYKVIVLANTACIDEEQAEGIREFVRNGGGVVATQDTSLFDEIGSARENYLLADVFGVNYLGTPSGEGGKTEQLDINFSKGVGADYFTKRRNIFDFKMNSPSLFAELPKTRLGEYIGTGPVVFKGSAVSVQPSTTTVTQTLATIAPRVAGAPAIPAVLTSTYGKGRVVFLAAGMDSAYYSYSYPYQRLVLAQAMRWAASAPPTIEVDAPMNVQTTFFRQKSDGERLVVHLLNDFDSSSRHGFPNEAIPMREEIVPMRDLKVVFKGYNITRIHLEPEGREMEMESVEGGIRVSIPRLDIHSLVVAELQHE